MPRPKKDATETKKTPETKKKEVTKKVAKTAEKKAEKAVEKKVAEKAAEKKTTERKTAAKKATAARKTTKESTSVILQYAGMNVSYDDLIQNAKNKYQFDMGGDVNAIKDIDLYVKPDEGKVYFVINKKIEGDYDL